MMRAQSAKKINTPRQILFASLVGTAVEFFDFYIYATAAVLVFPKLFFRHRIRLRRCWHHWRRLRSPLWRGRLGRCVRALRRPDRAQADAGAGAATMGVSTFVIGTLPSYHAIGIAAPVLLALCRFGQGIGLGGEWGGAVLLAVENAPPSKRALYGMFPQLGAPLGFLLSGGIFLVLQPLSERCEFFGFGWRMPFLASSVLVLLGLYVRLTITETPVFEAMAKRKAQMGVPILIVFRRHAREVVAGILVCLAHVCPVLPDDGIRTVVGDDRIGLRSFRVSGDAIDRRGVFRGYDSDFSMAGGARTTACACLRLRS